MVHLMTFDEAVSDAVSFSGSQPTVLLGNGFSIDYDNRIFNYDSLAAQASLSGLSVTKAALFAAAQSNNFETVVDKLQAAADLQDLYKPGGALAGRLRSDAAVVRHGLAEALATRHPDKATDVDDDEILHARTFLANFQAIFTVNYDLLLYWAVTRDAVGPFVWQKDGFEWPTWRVGPLIWKRNPTQGAQRIFYLHGALHLFVEDQRLTKLSGFEHGRLISELRQRLNDDKYPLVVTEGTRTEKEAHIEKSAYLRTSHRRFGEVGDSLFIHGMSLSPNDDHILELIETDESEITALYVAVHGDPGTRAARRVIDRAKRIRDERRDGGGAALRLKFYDSTSAHVWR